VLFSPYQYRQRRVVAFPERGQQLAARLAERPHGPDERLTRSVQADRY